MALVFPPGVQRVADQLAAGVMPSLQTSQDQEKLQIVLRTFFEAVNGRPRPHPAIYDQLDLGVLARLRLVTPTFSKLYVLLFQWVSHYTQLYVATGGRTLPRAFPTVPRFHEFYGYLVPEVIAVYLNRLLESGATEEDYQFLVSRIRLGDEAFLDYEDYELKVRDIVDRYRSEQDRAERRMGWLAAVHAHTADDMHFVAADDDDDDDEGMARGAGRARR